jgi:hypothetical protein
MIQIVRRLRWSLYFNDLIYRVLELEAPTKPWRVIPLTSVAAI